MSMFTSSYKAIALITGLFIGGFLFGQFWRYLGDNDAIINRYLEVHNARFISEDNSSQVYYVFYNNFESFSDFIKTDKNYLALEAASMKNLATVTINNSSLPDSLNSLRQQDFIRFIFPGTFPFICH